jgi:hypothetical protein
MDMKLRNTEGKTRAVSKNEILTKEDEVQKCINSIRRETVIM